MSELTLEMLPAAEGDALLLGYGAGPDRRWILVDGGRRSTYDALRKRLTELPVDDEGVRRLELLVISHVDADHIEGIICLLQDEELACEFGDIWFNGWKHLEPLVPGQRPPHLGPEQGEFLGALIQELGHPWNRAFGGGAVVVPPEGAALPTRSLKGGMKLTVVSPTIESLIELREKWAAAIRAAGFAPGDRRAALRQFAEKRWASLPRDVVDLGDEDRRSTLDHAEANGSSIALLVEFGGLRLLLSGDAWPQVLRPGLTRWREGHETVPARVPLDAFKLAHHGSTKNITPQLMDEIDCPTYLVSTSGARFHHPDVEAIKILIAGHRGDGKPVLLFNYRSDENDVWEGQDTCDARYEADAKLVLEVR